MSTRARLSNKRGRARAPALASSSEEESADSDGGHEAEGENPAADAPTDESQAAPVPEQGETADESQVLTQDEQGNGTTQADEEFLDILMDLQPPPVADSIPEYYAKDFENVPDRLRNLVPMQTFDLPMEICEDVHNLISPDPAFVGTMAGASKTFITIKHDDPSHLVQPYEGAPFTFVDK